MTTPQENITQLRRLMAEQGLSAYIIPSTDPHASEYMAAHWQEITWLTGFKGETGTGLVTPAEAFLWTDSRYYLQADKELAGSGVSLMKSSEIDTPTIPQWLVSNLKAGQTVGINPEMFTVREYEELRSALNAAELTIKSCDLISPLWIEGRPAIPENPLYEYDEKFAGESVSSKLNRVRQAIAEQGANTMIISALDEIAWLLNIRGTDVECNPVVISYLLLNAGSVQLFVEPTKIDNAAAAYLQRVGVEYHPYTDIFAAISRLTTDDKVLYDGARLNQALREAIPSGCKQIDVQSPILVIKSQKNEVELEGERTAMLYDCIALTRFFRWLERNAFAEKYNLTEYDLMVKLRSLRAAQPNFRDESFGTIAGYEANGAIVHYAATPTDCATLEPQGILLLDSGGQYLDGTTDITRTIWIGDIPKDGELKREEYLKARRDFTLVLKGHIALATARFPRGTRGNQLDALAKQYMWQEGITFGHGTGHGVGHFLGCHEGPQGFKTDLNPAPLRLGNVCSDEPGIYRTGEYGIRIENLIAVREAEQNQFGEFYEFETITLCFYDRKLIDTDLLSDKEREWINRYHHKVLQAATPHLTADEVLWLQEKCKEL